MSKKPDLDIPGDAVATARAVTTYWYNVGVSLGDLDRYRDTDHLQAPVLTEIRVRCDPEDAQGVLIVAKGLSEDGHVVAFHRGETIVEALQGMARRLKNQTAKWRKDEYAGSS